MYRKLLLIFTASLIFSCGTYRNSTASKIKILGVKINQKDLCAESGNSNLCNPFPYGTSKIMQNYRWTFPTQDTEGNLVPLNIKDLAKKYIGGVYVNSILPVPAELDIQNHYLHNGYIDIHSASVTLEIKDSLIRRFNANADLEKIIKSLAAGDKLKEVLIGNQNEVKDSMDNIYSRLLNRGELVNAIYHSIKLNGNWYSDALYNKNKLALRMLDHTYIANKKNNSPFANDQITYITGLGIIEYTVNSSTDIMKSMNIDLGDNLTNRFKILWSNEINSSLTKVVPVKYDLVLLSVLPNKRHIVK